MLNNVSSTLSSAYNSTSETISSTYATASGLGSHLASALSSSLDDSASTIQDSANDFRQGASDWWDAVKANFAKQSRASEPPSPPSRKEWAPGEGPGEPRNSGGGEALVGLTAGAMMQDDQEEEDAGQDDHQLLQLTKKLIEIRSVPAERGPE